MYMGESAAEKLHVLGVFFLFLCWNRWTKREKQRVVLGVLARAAPPRFPSKTAFSFEPRGGSRTHRMDGWDGEMTPTWFYWYVKRWWQDGTSRGYNRRASPSKEANKGMEEAGSISTSLHQFDGCIQGFDVIISDPFTHKTNPAISYRLVSLCDSCARGCSSY